MHPGQQHFGQRQGGAGGSRRFDQTIAMPGHQLLHAFKQRGVLGAGGRAALGEIIEQFLGFLAYLERCRHLRLSSLGWRGSNTYPKGGEQQQRNRMWSHARIMVGLRVPPASTEFSRLLFYRLFKRSDSISGLPKVR